MIEQTYIDEYNGFSTKEANETLNKYLSAFPKKEPIEFNGKKVLVASIDVERPYEQYLRFTVRLIVSF